MQLGAAAIYIANIAITLVIYEDLFLIYQRERISLRDSIKHVKFYDFVWLSVFELAGRSFFVVILGILYWFAYLLWTRLYIDLSIVFIALCIVIYPVWYLTEGTIYMISVLPLDNLARWTAMKYLMTPRALSKLYIFFGIRLIFEGIFVLVVPPIVSLLTKSRFLTIFSITLGFMSPFVILTGSSYELRLQLYNSNQTVRRIFHRHYADIESALLADRAPSPM